MWSLTAFTSKSRQKLIVRVGKAGIDRWIVAEPGDMPDKL